MEIDRPIFIFLILIAIICLIFALILPRYHEFKILQGKSVEKEAEFKAKSEYYFRIEDVFEDLERREEQLFKIDTAIPTEIDFSSLLYFLQKTAFENGVILTSLRFQKSLPLEIKEKEISIQENFFIFKITATYTGFKNFLFALEKSARLIEVEDISSFSANLDKKGTGIKTFEFEIKVYSIR